MTNEQLKILLESQAVLLEKAIEEAENLLPENAEEEMEETYVGPVNLTAGFTLNKNPDHYKMQGTGRAVALIPLYEHLKMIRIQIDSLVKPLILEGGKDPIYI